MSFLTPLFFAGLLAVGLPIFFHMIRRTPRGRMPFSSLMFLEPSPPRVTRRSRLDNWLLLLLRAIAVCLLVLAFARPFFRETVDTSTETLSGRRLAILLDTSASMRRGTLWDDAVKRAEDVLRKTEPQDEVSIFTFDRDWKPVLAFEEWASLQPAARVEAARKRLERITPGWGATNLGRALVETAESLDAASSTDEQDSQSQSNELILISDLQSGSLLHDLQAFSWPETVLLTVSQIKPGKVTNAGIQLIAESPESRNQNDSESVRLRVTNAADSEKEQFQLKWVNDFAVDSSTRDQNSIVDVYVPPGTSRVVRIPVQKKDESSSYGQLLLTGDDHDFDNRVFVERPVVETSTVIYFGSDSADDSRQLLYFLERAFPADARRSVKLVAQNAESPSILAAAKDVQLVIVTEAPPESHLTAFRQFVKNGGTLLYIAQASDDCRAFGRLVELGNLESVEAEVSDYALLEEIDYSHPLFAIFSESRFSDFTKIHIWKHRDISPESLPENCRTLARFDNGSPALLEVAQGEGKALLLTTAWTPEESQLARSSKFPLLMNRLLELASGRTEQSLYFTVGDAIPLPTAKTKTEKTQKPSMLTVRLPDQSEILLASGQGIFRETVVPGIYHVNLSGKPETVKENSRQFAVNLAAEESKTAPLALEQFEALEIPVTNSSLRKSSEETVAARNRQLRSRELENQQKLWRWLIVAALVVLAVETILARVLANKQALAENG